MADQEENKDNIGEELIPIFDDYDDLKNGESKSQGPIIPIDPEWLNDYGIKMCPECGTEYDGEEYIFCPKDRGRLFELWKCQVCGEDFSKAQGYTAINICPNCGKSLDKRQREAINVSKKSEKNILKRICSNPECRKTYDDNFKYCIKCASDVIPMQCSCGEIFRQREDGSFDKFCPVCGKHNPIADRKQGIIKIGDIIELGSWRYETDGSKRPIKWMAIETDGENTAVLLTCYAIDNHAYHGERTDITWAESDIRAWLNGEFYDKAFSEEEKRRIIPARLENKDNIGKFTQEYVDYFKRWGADPSSFLGQKWHTRGGVDTTDKVWLLSLDDMRKYSGIFRTDKDRQLKATPNMWTRYKHDPETDEYVRRNGAVGNVRWWLRSPGCTQDTAVCVFVDGFIVADGNSVVFGDGGVRAALIIDLRTI